MSFDNSLNRFFDWCGTSPICGFEGGRPAFDESWLDGDHPAAGDGLGRPAAGAAGRRAERRPAAALPRHWPLLADALTLAQAGDGSLLLAISDAARGRNDDGTYATGIDAFVEQSCADPTTRARPTPSRRSGSARPRRRHSSG